jgi:glutaminase
MSIPRSRLSTQTGFGICVADTRGLTAKAGDADVEFSIMSVAKPFVFALMCGVHTPNAVAHFVGLNATGKKFNSVGAIEDHLDGRTNPMVNPGQLPRRAWLPATTWKKSGVSSMRVCLVLPGVNYKSMRRFWPRPRPTNSINRAIGDLLRGYGRLATDSIETVDLYTRQSCLRVTASDLAVMAATVASGGVNPSTGEQVVDQVSCRCALVVMATAGLYETSGDWLYAIGLPGKVALAAG